MVTFLEAILVHVAPVRLFAVTCAVVAVVELSWPARRASRLRTELSGRVANVAALAVTLGLIGVLLEAAPWLVRFPWVFTTEHRGLADALVPSAHRSSALGVVVTTLVYALVWDFFQYWTHRAQHEWAILWPMHEVHHSDRSMTATTSGRQSVPSALFGLFAVHVPTILVVGPSALSLVGSVILFNGWGFLNHANVRLSFGRLTPVLSGPQLHRMHHGADRRYHGRNYAAFFPFYDRLFGTLLLPAPAEWPATGTRGSHRRLVVAAVWPWQRPTAVEARGPSGDPPTGRTARLDDAFPSDRGRPPEATDAVGAVTPLR